ncbi:heavy-metal-associated domain-containing protein [Alkaliphilus sp. MSJ-5]|uniref:Heavy-metal-associated domain-containing protein n=1 Tax=Alkaliphilus flagellatus TaxID=2841507 RepID=A0ABS6FZT6_9FIRM|nr:heavy metal-associated domain-containing protein [Alkaliphilus flagellatus]MBU5675759.1 heavy-metal-associated domain-containing protein [Alkaliphilus flagellatus]
MKKKIMIEGMSCGHCSGRVEKALKDQGAVKEVTVDLAGKNAIVELSADISDEAIKEIIEDAGYDVVDIENL